MQGIIRIVNFKLVALGIVVTADKNRSSGKYRSRMLYGAVFRIVIKNRNHDGLALFINFEHVSFKSGNNAVLSTHLNAIIPVLARLHSCSGQLSIQIINHVTPGIITLVDQNIDIFRRAVKIIDRKLQLIIFLVDLKREIGIENRRTDKRADFTPSILVEKEIG